MGLEVRQKIALHFSKIAKNNDLKTIAVVFQNRPSQKLHAQKKIKWADVARRKTPIF